MESKPPVTILESIQNRYREYPQPFRVWYVCSTICAISIAGFYRLHLHARERFMENQRNSDSGWQEGAKDAI
jgi:hypothetical protein